MFNFFLLLNLHLLYVCLCIIFLLIILIFFIHYNYLLPYPIEHNYSSCVKVLIHLHHLRLTFADCLFPWEWMKLSWFTICWIILDWILEVVNLLYEDSWILFLQRMLNVVLQAVNLVRLQLSCLWWAAA